MSEMKEEHFSKGNIVAVVCYSILNNNLKSSCKKTYEK